MTDAKKSIADLCKPLSAKVMPKRMLYNSDSTERSNEDAFRIARQSKSVAIPRAIKARKAYGV